MIKSKNVAKLLLIVGILCSILGVSYALFIKNLSGSNNNSLTATCFNVSFTDQNNIGLTNTYPLLDEDGKKLTPYEFTVTNNCDTFVKYDINLEILNTSTLTNMDYIKLMLDDGAPALVSRYDVTTKTLSNASSAYKIKGDLYLDAKESKTYKLRLWLDENVTTETEGVQNKSFASKITVNASYTEKIPTAVDTITKLAETDTTNLATDDYGNIRYIGENPNNYVTVDGELWRIISVMKDIDDGTGTKESRVKLIRKDRIGDFTYDVSDSDINYGLGINEWSQAKLMKLLNPGYESESIGGSLYWNSGSGKCYERLINETINCNFTSTGVKAKLKTLIGDAVWNTGAADMNGYTAKEWYLLERGTQTGRMCEEDELCNDTVERTTTWTGKVGLMYPSDYRYATVGGNGFDRTACLNKKDWDSNLYGCYINDWLYDDGEDTITLTPYVDGAYWVFNIRHGNNEKDITPESEYYALKVLPVVYLLHEVFITNGTGSESDPFVLGI